MRDYQKLLTSVYMRADKQTAIVEREMAGVYRSAYDELTSSLGSLYTKMGDTPSIQEARRYNRLSLLKDEIRKAYKQLARVDIKYTEANGAGAFANLAYGTQWAIDQATGIELKWNIIPVSAIRASVFNDVNGESYQDRFINWSIKDQMKMNTQIGIGLTLGEPYAKVARRIKDVVQASYGEAIRIVRTENTRNQSLGHLATYDIAEELGVEMKKKWVATLDERTRASHGHLDGTYADKDGLFWIDGDSAEAPGMFGVPEHDINCRCRVSEEIEGLEPELRRTRDEGVIDYVTFDTWAEARGYKDGKWPIEKKI